MYFTKPLPEVGGNLKLLVALPQNHGPKLLLCGSPAFFISMATRMLQLLAGEVQERKAQRCDQDVPLFKENEMLIFVGMSLGRLLGLSSSSRKNCCLGTNSGGTWIWRALR